jgi:hypothetical protein
MIQHLAIPFDEYHDVIRELWEGNVTYQGIVDHLRDEFGLISRLDSSLTPAKSLMSVL